MGIYIFRSLHAPFVKLGSYVCRGRRAFDNPWYRIAGRGFHNITHPPELHGKSLSAEGFELVVWFPNLGRREEGKIHRAFAVNRIGEFHPAHEEPLLIEMCEGMGGRSEEVTAEQKVAAFSWAHPRSARIVRPTTTQTHGGRRAKQKNVQPKSKP